MNQHFSFRLPMMVLALVFISSLAMRAHAQVTVVPQAELTDVYNLIKQANNNYHGHTQRALLEIRMALADLGSSFPHIKTGPDTEPQYLSDAQLRSAMLRLQELTPVLTGSTLAHVNAAANELAAALLVN